MKALLCMLAALAQDPTPAAPPAAQGSARPWVNVDRIVMVVNQDIITEYQLDKALARLAKTRKLTSDTEIHAAKLQILNELVRERLRVQAGALLGVDEKLIDARVAESLEQMRKRSGGVVGLVHFLESRDVAGPDVRRLLRDDIYDSIYRDGVIGDAPGPLGRITADRYIRPGALSLLFSQAIERPGEMEALGGTVGKVKFQQIVLDPEASGGIEATQALARDLAARIQAGEDMGPLARQYGGAREDDGIVEVEIPRLRDLFPEIARFTSQAEPGQLSGPIESKTREKPTIRIVRFLERQAAVVPDFETHEVQAKLRKSATERLEQYRLESGYGALLASSYVWPPELAGRER
jgi:peptidyl-prolyl cis-trans isomerase SurA